MQGINGLIAASAALAVSAGTAGATLFFFEATIDQSQTTALTGSPATGTLTGTYDDVANEFAFSYSITNNLIGTPASPGAHIHNAPPGSNGGIVFAFSGGVWNLSDNFVWSGLTAGNVSELFAGNLYANFHTTSFPGGEIRGNIMLVPSPAGAAMLGIGGLVISRRRR